MSDVTGGLPVSAIAPSFVFATCKEGWEKAVKEAAKNDRHGLRPAYMRPGLITWKAERPASPDFLLASPFARLSGLSLGSFKEAADLWTKLGELRTLPWRLHVFPREMPENGWTVDQWSKLDARRQSLLAGLRALGASVSDEEVPQFGDAVLDVILEDDEAAPFFAGWHRHSADRHRCAGAIPRAVLPPEAPSRAWLKLEQALAFAGLDHVRSLAGKVVLELGSAPGGASYALLDRGAKVFGVDPGEMDRRIIHYKSPTGAAFVHLRMPAGDVPPALLPSQADVLVSDLNIAPVNIIRCVQKLQAHVHARLFILTLKINDRTVMAKLGEALDWIRKFAPGPVRATQLPANRDEICVVAGRVGDRGDEL